MLDEKIIVLAKKNDELVGFVSALPLQIDDTVQPVIHTGLTAIHSNHRKQEMMQSKFAHLFIYLLEQYTDRILAYNIGGYHQLFGASFFVYNRGISFSTIAGQVSIRGTPIMHLISPRKLT